MHASSLVRPVLAVLVLAMAAMPAAAAGAPARPNVLLLAMDDLRPELGAYGYAHVKTPSIDALARQGVMLSRAYVNMPVCGASRASMLSGLRPTVTRFKDVASRIDRDAPGVVTLPGHFKAHGYTTVSLGKVLHEIEDSADAWSREPWHPRNREAEYRSWRNYVLPENIAADMDKDRQPPPYEMADVDDDAYFDGQIARRAVETLEELKRDGKPFFLAVGFLKPHLPFNAPKRYWDLYPEASVALTDNPLFPPTAPDAARHNWGELRNYAEVPDKEGPVPDDVARRLVRGYHASTSYSDAQVGRVLAALDRLGLADDTIVLLWGDHGWSLGEHGLWAKHSSFNVANRIPLIVRAPGIRGGQAAAGLVESVDVYPTLAALAGLPLPAHLQGNSFAALLKDPGTAAKAAVFPRWKAADSIRTDRYYYTEWRNEAGAVTARMLYDHEQDPDERVNVAEQPGYAQAVEELSAALAAHLRSLQDR